MSCVTISLPARSRLNNFDVRATLPCRRWHATSYFAHNEPIGELPRFAPQQIGRSERVLRRKPLSKDNRQI
jgi:hypothetical protein